MSFITLSAMTAIVVFDLIKKSLIFVKDTDLTLNSEIIIKKVKKFQKYWFYKISYNRWMDFVKSNSKH